MILEYDLRPSRGLREDLKHIQMGLAVVIHQTPEVLRVVRKASLMDPVTKNETPPSLVVVEFLRTKDGLWDDDIEIGGVRYATRSGVKVRGHYPITCPMLMSHDLGSIYERFLSKPRNIDLPHVRRLAHNRIKKYLS